MTEAMLLFWRKGFHATSLRDLGEALDIRMPSLYAAFGSKEALYVEAVDLYMRVTRTLLWQHLENGEPARAAIRALLLATAKELTNDEAHPGGCMVTFATTDEDMPADVVTAIRQAREAWLDIIRERLQVAMKEGELPDSTDVNGLSRFYFSMVQSIGIQAHDGVPYPELETIVDIAMSAWPGSPATSAAPKKSRAA
ncbi:TetR/AcrR family transcriptional regulator [Paraburkholderia sp. DHOC27]|uniref:TetR/AcrR family transcriptional regulator n=1 Tax=Paraburkholderia sp. DHOC27 TaxID=2303330 RepID=UPI0015F2F1D3|nr:TetR/AcrR family transcriptional regulator [Paraburkholderia sp. DHOC27]